LAWSTAACGGILLDDDDGGTADASKKDVIANDVPMDCNPPLTKCGSICVNTNVDPSHCGSCTTACASDGDGAVPVCSGGICSFMCNGGLTQCADGVCYDLQTSHDHCGTCTTSCQPTETCTQGKCCGAGGTELCNGVCTDVLSDPQNCGACGKPCPPQSVCSSGTCTTSTGGSTYSQSFTEQVVATSQCIAWNTWRANLTGTYTSVTLSGSNDTTGRTCTGSGANTLCQALRTGATVSNLSCGGYTWNVDFCSGMTWELTADNGACSCTNPGYNIRPCINTNGDWGGITTKTCSAPSQTLSVTCQ
jgi:hypothetical protein